MKKYGNLIYPFISTTAIYLAFTLSYPYEHGLFGIPLLSLDFLLQVLFGLLLFSLIKKRVLFPLIQFFLMGLLYLASPVKMSLFSGTPFSPYDLGPTLALFEILPLTTQVLIAVPVLLFLLLLVTSIRLTKKNVSALALFAIASGVALGFYPSQIKAWLDMQYPTQIWNKGYNYLNQGASVYTLHQTTRFLTDNISPPTQIAVAHSATVLAGLRGTSSPQNKSNNISGKRSVHLVLVESFIDPLTTLNLPKEKDPFYAPFRRLYQQGGSSVSLSPVYTGGTANAEFEILCGMPIMDGIIAFENKLTNREIPCLPRQLAQAGYRTIASHPYKKNFWNRDSAYPRIGFDTYRHRADFQQDDLNGGLLSDESLFRQNRAYLKHVSKPLFDYTLTLSEHYPYTLNQKRKKTQPATTDNNLVNRYLSTIYHSTREIYAHIEALRQADPSSLIIVTGDHTPFFGPSLSGYRELNAFRHSRNHFDKEDLLKLTSTPLLVIDGKRGPLAIGRIAHYELPSLILSLLGLPAQKPQTAIQPPSSLHIRPIPGYPVLAWDRDGAFKCTGDADAPRCKTIVLWQRNVEVLMQDTLSGKQYLLSRNATDITP